MNMVNGYALAFEILQNASFQEKDDEEKSG
jgi:hypothetical protein